MNENTALFLAIFTVFALVFPLAPLAMAKLWFLFFSPQEQEPIKTSTYECGLESGGDSWIQFRAQYSLYAIVFLIFDVEAVILFPFAVAYAELSAGAIFLMAIFLLLFVEGLVWALANNHLKWS